VVLISHTGRTKSLVEVAGLAKENGATVIAITAKDSPLDKASSLSISLDIPEDTDVYMPMASRIVQMTIIDVLATGFTLRRGSGFRENLRRVKDSLRDSRYDKNSQF
jgi:RpiR family carbohydrate utilization transcriptional regulator